MTVKAGSPAGKEYRAVSGASAPLQLGPTTTHSSSSELSSSTSSLSVIDSEGSPQKMLDMEEITFFDFVVASTFNCCLFLTSFLIIYISWSGDAFIW